MLVLMDLLVLGTENVDDHMGDATPASDMVVTPAALFCLRLNHHLT